MEYWRGRMNWPIALGWACETCGNTAGLTWGFVHGTCRCDRCHTQYTMRPVGEVVTVPVCRLKEEYKGPAKAAWEKYQIPIDMLTDAQWEETDVRIDG